MNPTRRRRYLNALSIDSYRSRSSVAEQAVEEVAVETLSNDGRRFAAEPQVPFPSAPTRSLIPAPALEASPSIASRPAVDVPADWSGLRAMVKDCPRCKLCATRTQTVFGVGPEDAPLMIVGEGPGADEDMKGEPFVGKAGKLLDQMLASIGRSRGENTYIANVVKCRPPGNRDPEADEVAACRPYLDRQIELLKPRLIVALGRVAAQRLLQSDAPLSRLRGPLYQYGAERTPVLVTYHPAYLLRSPREKSKSWDDLKRVHQLLAQSASAVQA
jgi:uracil-DNA glycosylase family 4